MIYFLFFTSFLFNTVLISLSYYYFCLVWLTIFFSLLPFLNPYIFFFYYYFFLNYFFSSIIFILFLLLTYLTYNWYIRNFITYFLAFGLLSLLWFTFYFFLASCWILFFLYLRHILISDSILILLLLLFHFTLFYYTFSLNLAYHFI